MSNMHVKFLKHRYRMQKFQTEEEKVKVKRKFAQSNKD